MNRSPTRTFCRAASRLGLALALALPLAAHAQHAAEEPSPGALPAQELTAETLYQFLLAEIAGARGELGLSVRAYLEVARRTGDPRIARRAAEIALFARDLDAATQAARIWTQADPQSEDARRLLAGVLASGGERLDDVQIQFARVLAESPERLPQNLMSLNRALARVPDKLVALRIIERLTEPYLNLPEAHFARAQAAAIAQDPVEGLAAIDDALALQPDWEPAVLLKAQLFQQADAVGEAARMLEDFLTRHPENRNARLTYARALVAEQQFEPAREQFQRLLAEAPGDRDLGYAVGLLSAQLGDYELAERLLAEALAAGHPEGDAIRFNLAQIAEQRDNVERALALYDEIADGPHALQARVRSAQLLARAGRLDEARSRLHAPDADDDTRKRLLLAETQLLRDVERPEEAFQLIDGALQKYPEDTDLLYESAMLAERLDRVEVMEARLRKLIALDPEHAHAYNALGYSLADRGLRLEEAEELIAHALELAPEDPFILDSMGWVLFRRGQAAEAVVHLERAYAIRADPEIAAHLGEVLWSLERRADAERIWEEALAQHPEHAALRETIRRLRP
ncbi:tetratricopeptide repeat protein [Pseudothauera nasutitermitis]|uniref:Tetratricopeptide repeat protein n=1 Tax=Pseudothauera nasutitermitis TaxID=2565930 RepID=A0A4S4AWY5_9RHOO|nr:tetratricopeptide repeat protein [Pseudothauera nasutitermitis]THF63795.1 tetratricopeptide repeat protein [Pseudothauera nasutitermitis]